MPSLLRLPAEVLDNVALSLVHTQFLGPPFALLPLLLTCSRLNQALSPVRNPNFGIGSRIFRQKFDSAAIQRRQPRHVLTSDLYVNQLIRYCNALQIIKTGDIEHEDAYEALWVCFLMMLEDDGRNGAQVREWANAKVFVQNWICHKLYRETSNGWPIDTNENGLALWIYWQISSEEDVENEKPMERKEFIDKILPFVIMSYRYPSVQCPPNHFRLPIKEIEVLFPTLPNTGGSMHPPEHTFPYSLITVHGAYPLYLNPENSSVVYDWWGIHIPFTHIAAGLVSKLLYFARRDQFYPISDLPATRAEAEAMGRRFGLTAEDMEEAGSFRSTVLPSFPAGGITSYIPQKHDSTQRPFQSLLNPRDDAWDSARWDIDWIRWTHCLDPRVNSNAALGPIIPSYSSRPGRAGLIEKRTLTPRRECYDMGSMAGLWQGKMILPAESCHLRLLMSASKPSDLSEEMMGMTASVIYMRLRELHSVFPNKPLPAGSAKGGVTQDRNDEFAGTRRVDSLPDFDDGAQNAWFPWDMDRTSTAETETFFVDKETHHYHLHGLPNPSSRAHNPHTCQLCLEQAKRVAEREREWKAGQIRAMAEPYEHLFGQVGLEIEEPERFWDTGPDEWANHENEECLGVQDIIFIGETDQRHGLAWGPYLYYGRMRRWDGLIGLLRLSPSSDALASAIFFHGYLVGGRNFVGTWRMAYEEMGIPAWECAFSMSKREDE